LLTESGEADRHELEVGGQGLHSPDDADALFLTFAQQVMPKPPKLAPDPWRERLLYQAGELSWMAR
jgi:hypothetical protein